MKNSYFGGKVSLRPLPLPESECLGDPCSEGLSNFTHDSAKRHWESEEGGGGPAIKSYHRVSLGRTEAMILYFNRFVPDHYLILVTEVFDFQITV
jgi:hypothetical protein